VNPRARKLRPYFPGYLFVNVDWEQDGFSALRWVPGAIGWVEFGGQPAWVPDALVHAIQRKVAAINEAGAKKRNGLQPGEQVVVLEGPFAGYEAIFDDHASGEERVRVLLTLISKRQLLLELPLSQIERKRQS
jgi:transcriptional antiterminator RfaH